MKEEKHAEFSPSSLNNLEVCPGWRHRPDQEGKKSPAAELGTKIHEALETGKIDELPDEGDAKHMARQCVDFIDSIMADRLPATPTQDFRERKLTIKLGEDMTTYGTLDRLIIFGRKGFLVDYKTGRREVIDAELNLQTSAYALGVFQAHPELETIESHILLPARNEISSYEFPRAAMPDMSLRINTVIRRAMENNPALYNPQAGLCEFCAQQGSCPALGKKALLISAKLGPGLAIPQSLTVSKDRPQDIPQILALAPIIESWAKGQREEALRLNLEEGVQIAGYQRVTRSLPRAVTSVLGAYEAVKDKITLEAYLAACSKVSVPDLEDFFAEQAPNKKKGKARQELEDRLRSAGVLRESSDIYYLKKKI